MGNRVQSLLPNNWRRARRHRPLGLSFLGGRRMLLGCSGMGMRMGYFMYEPSETVTFFGRRAIHIRLPRWSAAVQHVPSATAPERLELARVVRVMLDCGLMCGGYICSAATACGVSGMSTQHI